MIARERLSLHADRPESLFQVVHGHSPRKRGAPSLGSHTLDSRRRRRKIRYALMAAFGLAVCLLLLLINAESVRKLAGGKHHLCEEPLDGGGLRLGALQPAQLLIIIHNFSQGSPNACEGACWQWPPRGT